MNGQQPKKGLASTVSTNKIKGLPKLSQEYLLKTPKVDKKMLAKMSLEDPPIEPVYSMSPVMLKQGLAAALASFGLGI